MKHRVVVTGMAGLSPLGNDWETVSKCLLAGKSGVEAMPEWAEVDGLQTRLGGPVHGFEVPAHWTRKKTRTMGRVSLLSTRATELALEDAGLLGSQEVSDGTTGISHGSTSGSPPMIGEYSIRLARLWSRLDQSTRTVGRGTVPRMHPNPVTVSRAPLIAAATTAFKASRRIACIHGQVSVSHLCNNLEACMLSPRI